MTGKNVFLLILGVVLFMSALIAILGLVAETPEHMIPREHICVASPRHHENFNSIWDSIVLKTGIDEHTAALTRISLDVDPDDSVEKMELHFIAEKKGVAGLYSIWYRRDSPACGWIDGLAYPKIFPEIEPANSQDPRKILEEIREIPLSAMDLSGKKVRVLGECTQSPQDDNPDSAPLMTGFLWTNRSLVPQISAQYDPQSEPHFGLDFAQMNCTILRGGMMTCQQEHSTRVVSTTTGSICRQMPHISQ